MKPGACLLVALLATAQPCLAKAAEPVRIELNALNALTLRRTGAGRRL